MIWYTFFGIIYNLMLMATGILLVYAVYLFGKYGGEGNPKDRRLSVICPQLDNIEEVVIVRETMLKKLSALLRKVAS